jgi:hypothetical protein
MRWINDSTGRFGRRPFYEYAEIEAECENCVADFFLNARGQIKYPLATDDLTLLLEHYADLDLYANLSEDHEDVEGLTSFASGRRPIVRISALLSSDVRRSNRLRTTLAHEFGHVRLHNILFQEELRGIPLFGIGQPRSQSCRRQTIAAASPADWMEFQAGHVCTALLAPRRAVLEIAAAHVPAGSLLTPGTVQYEGALLAVSKGFEISIEAARVRLSTLGAVAVVGQGQLI